MKYTHFYDMHSGGSLKEKWGHIIIEAPEDEACIVFYNRFGHNPHRVTCTCCGSDYSINEWDSLDELFDTYGLVAGLATDNGANSLLIRTMDITDDERSGKLPTQGYVWAG